ncbi:unnamed protein product [Ixodes pacificus]
MSMKQFMVCRPDKNDTVAVDFSVVLGLRRWPIHFVPGMCRTSFIVKFYSKMFVSLFSFPMNFRLPIWVVVHSRLQPLLCNRHFCFAFSNHPSGLCRAVTVYLTNVTHDAPMVTSEGSGFVHAIWCPYI